jgi:hypothetical protein
VPGKCDWGFQSLPQTLVDWKLTPGRRGWGDKRRVEGANASRKKTIPGQDVYANKNLKNANGPQGEVQAQSLVVGKVPKDQEVWPDFATLQGDRGIMCCGGAGGGGQALVFAPNLESAPKHCVRMCCLDIMKMSLAQHQGQLRMAELDQLL